MTENSLRNAIARALFEAYGDTASPGWDAEYPSMKRTYFDQADAVLAVLADPPAKVVERVAEAIEDEEEYPHPRGYRKHALSALAAFGGEQSDG